MNPRLTRRWWQTCCRSAGARCATARPPRPARVSGMLGRSQPLNLPPSSAMVHQMRKPMCKRFACNIAGYAGRFADYEVAWGSPVCWHC